MSFDTSIFFREAKKDGAGLFHEALSLRRRAINLLADNRIKDQGARRGLIFVTNELSLWRESSFCARFWT